MILQRSYLFVHYLPSFNLHRPQHILVKIIAVLFFHRKAGIGVILPAAAQIKTLVYAADFIFSGNTQPHRIIFTVADIGEAYFTDDRCVESTGSAHSVDTCLLYTSPSPRDR